MSCSQPLKRQIKMKAPLMLRSWVLAAITLSMMTGCLGTSFHDRQGWEASEFFDDSKVIELCDAIEANDLDRMQAAVEAGADINAVGKHGMTPLMWAFLDHQIERFRWLLERGADPNVCITEDIGASPPDIQKGWSVTFLSIQTTWTDYYPLVLKHGGDPNLKCHPKFNPLIFTAKLTPDPINRIEALLDAGANIDAKRRQGTTLIMSAVSSNHYQLALMLLKRGADIELYQEKFNRQLVHFLVAVEELPEARRYRGSDENRQAYLDIVKILKERGVDFEDARTDLERWKKWITIKQIKEGREREYAERKERERQDRENLSGD